MKFYVKTKLSAIGKKMSQHPKFTLSAIATFATFSFVSITSPTSLATTLALSLSTGSAVYAIHTVQSLWQSARLAIFRRRLRVENSSAQESTPFHSKLAPNQTDNDLDEKLNTIKDCFSQLNHTLGATIAELKRVQDNNANLNAQLISLNRRLIEENHRLRSENERFKETLQPLTLASDMIDGQTDVDINFIGTVDPKEIFNAYHLQSQHQTMATSYEEKSQKHSPRPN